MYISFQTDAVQHDLTHKSNKTFKFVTAMKAESPTHRLINKNSPVIAEVSHRCHQFIIEDLLADLSVGQHQTPCCVARCCYGIVRLSHLFSARGDEAGELGQDLLCCREPVLLWAHSTVTYLKQTSTIHAFSYPWRSANCRSETCYPAGTWRSSAGPG